MNEPNADDLYRRHAAARELFLSDFTRGVRERVEVFLAGEEEAIGDRIATCSVLDLAGLRGQVRGLRFAFLGLLGVDLDHRAERLEERYAAAIARRLAVLDNPEPGS